MSADRERAVYCSSDVVGKGPQVLVAGSSIFVARDRLEHVKHFCERKTGQNDFRVTNFR